MSVIPSAEARRRRMAPPADASQQAGMRSNYIHFLSLALLTKDIVFIHLPASPAA